MTELKFDQIKVDKVEKDFSKVKLTPQQREHLNESAKIYANYIPISERAIKGFILFSMADYQVENKVDLSSFYDMKNEEKQKVIIGISDILRLRLNKILLDPKQEPLLTTAINEAIKNASTF